jgi:hypothetical protein
MVTMTRFGLFPIIRVTVVRTDTVDVSDRVGPPKREIENLDATLSAPRTKSPGRVNAPTT